MFTAESHTFTAEERRIFRTMANQASVAISLAQLHEELLDLRAIEHELEIAADIQRKLMPESAPVVPHFDVAGEYLPCYEIGGDFFDFIKLPENNLGITVGDVSGKGIPASLLMATTRTALRVQAENIFSMREVVGKVNQAIYEETSPEEFVTLFYGVLDVYGSILTYVNAGHNGALLIRNGTVKHLESTGPPLGILPEFLGSQKVLRLEKGDLVAIYTDGYSDIPGAEEDLFGDKRITNLLCTHAALPAQELTRRLEKEVTSFWKEDEPGDEPGYRDDRTIVVVKVLG